MKRAAIWADQWIEEGHLDDLPQFIRQIQDDALEAAARAVEKIDDHSGIDHGGPAAIRALKREVLS